MDGCREWRDGEEGRRDAVMERRKEGERGDMGKKISL